VAIDKAITVILNYMNAKKPVPQVPDCKEQLIAIKDTMILLSGKWKIQIIGWLLLYGNVRFMDMLRGIEGIAAKMLSKELQELEQNEIVARTVMPTKPITVEYELTEHGKTLSGVIDAISAWGVTHRKFLFKKES
jgi:DNA-binding HxlR family transcriptional regulator